MQGLKGRKELRALKAWVLERRERLSWAGGFLAVSLAVFLCLALPGANGPEGVARRYMDAALDYDYLGIYRLIDRRVLDRELELAGLDRAGMEERAATNTGLVAEYIGQIEDEYGVDITYTYAVTGQRPLSADALAVLALAYERDGHGPDLLAATQVEVHAVARLTGAERTETLERELSVTAIRTGRGWSLDKDSMHTFLELFYDLPFFAWEHFGQGE